MGDYPKTTVTYVAEASRDLSGGYTVTFPDLHGCITEGDTLKEAKKMAKEAIELHCECLVEDGLAELKIHRIPSQTRVRPSL